MDRLNDLIQQALIRKAEVERKDLPGKVVAVQYQDTSLINGVFRKGADALKTRTITLAPGSKIVLKEKYNNDLDMEAGTVWDIQECKGDLLTLNNKKEIDISKFKAFDLGYAKDSLASQGQSVTYVHLLLDQHIDDAGIYVLLTRHKGLSPKDCKRKNQCNVGEKGIRIYARESEFPNEDAVIQYIWEDLNEEGKNRTRRILLSSDAAALSEAQLLSLEKNFEHWDGISPFEVTYDLFQGNEVFLKKLKKHLALFGSQVAEKGKGFIITPRGKVKKFILDTINAALEGKRDALGYKNENLLELDDYKAPHLSKGNLGSKDQDLPSGDLMNMDEKDNLPPEDHNRSLNVPELDQDGEELLPLN